MNMCVNWGGKMIKKLISFLTSLVFIFNYFLFQAPIVLALSDNVSLSSLSLSVDISPAFRQDITTYTAAVDNSIESVLVTPVKKEETSTVSVNETNITDDNPSVAIPLNIGLNTIAILVTAQDGITTQTYTVQVTRADAVIVDLSALDIGFEYTPTFQPSVTEYAAVVSNSTTSITVKPTTADPDVSCAVNDVSPTGDSGVPVELSVGSNTVTVTVTAANGTTNKVYTVVVTRAEADNADLSSLSVRNSAISPTFDKEITEYTLQVNYPIGTVHVTAVPADSGATVKVNGTVVTDTSKAVSVQISTGNTLVAVEVTAKDSITKKTYTITVNRPASSNADLAFIGGTGVGSSIGTLVPYFHSETTEYTSIVEKSNSVAILTPQAMHPAAAITVNGIAITPEQPSITVPLAIGLNTIAVVVTAEDGTTTKTYTFHISRGATLKKLTSSSGTFLPAFKSGIASYSISSVVSQSLTLIPTVTDDGDTVKVNGKVVESGVESQVIPLQAGDNTINVDVTTQDGSFTNTYTITASRKDMTWQIVGQYGFSESADQVSLALSGAVPYVAFADSKYQNRLTVMKYNGSTWVTVGTAGFTAGAASNPDICMDGNTPVVAYTDQDGMAAVVKYNGAQWASVGNPHFKPKYAHKMTAEARNGNVYIAFEDANNSDKASVMYYNGTDWATLGGSLSVGSVDSLDLCLVGNIPYIAFCDDTDNSYTTSNQLIVQRYTGSGWETVGSGPVMQGYITDPCLAFIGGTPYLSFINWDAYYYSPHHPIIMSLTDNRWQSVGSIPVAQADLLSLAELNGNLAAFFFSSGMARLMVFNQESWQDAATPVAMSRTGGLSGLVISGADCYQAYNNNGQAVVQKLAPANNAELAALSVTNVPGKTAFTNNIIVVSGTLDYNTTVVGYAATAAVTAIAKDSLATVKINGTRVAWGSAVQVPLAVGDNGIHIQTISSDGFIASSYTVTIHRPMDVTLSGLTVGDIALTPEFSPDKFQYSVGNLEANVRSISVTPVRSDPNSVVKINGTVLPAGKQSASVGLELGLNKIVIEVSSPGGGDTKTYEADVTRLAHTWQGVGNPYLGLDKIYGGSIINDSGRIIVTFQKLGNSDKLYNYIYDGCRWQPLAILAPTDNIASYTSVLYGGQPCIAYSSYTSSYIAVYDGNAWVQIEEFQGTTSKIVLATGLGKLFAAYQDNTHGNKVTVKQYDGHSWTNVGSECFAGGVDCNNLQLAVGNSGPFVAFIKGSGSDAKVNVMQYTGSQWVMMGGAGFASVTVSGASIAVDGNTVYVAYSEYGYNGKTKVEKFELGEWKPIGTPLGTAGGCSVKPGSLTLDHGIPFLAFKDSSSNSPSIYKFENNEWKAITADDVQSRSILSSLVVSDLVPYLALYSSAGSLSTSDVFKYQSAADSTLTGLQVSNAGSDFSAVQTVRTAPDLYEYSVTASCFLRTVKVMAVPADRYASVSINGQAAAYGQYIEVPFEQGSNTTTIRVTALDGSSTKVYKLHINRTVDACLKGLSVSGLALSPAFHPDVTGYTTATVYADVKSVTVTPVLSDATATVTVNGKAAQSGMASSPIPLVAGTNVISIDVSSADETTHKAYSVTIEKIPYSWQNISPSAYGSNIYSGSLYIEETIPFVAYYWSGHSSVLVKKYTGADWEQLGSITVPNLRSFTKVLVADGVPYVAYDYLDSSNKRWMDVLRFDGTNWNKIGSFACTDTGYGKLGFASIDSCVYVAFDDIAHAGRLTVEKYTGSGWEIVGLAGISETRACDIVLAGSGGSLYTAFAEDDKNPKQVRTLRFSHGSWQPVGTEFTTTYPDASIWLTINGGTPYLCYKIETTGRLALKKLSAGQWLDVPLPEHYQDTLSQSAYITSAGGDLYLCRQNDIRLFKLTSVGWEQLGTSGSHNVSDYCAVAVSSGVVYQLAGDRLIKYQPGSEDSLANIVVSSASGSSPTLIVPQVGKLDYSVSLQSQTDKLSIRADAKDLYACVTINGRNAAFGQYTDVLCNPGKNEFVIGVISADGTETQQYVLTVVCPEDASKDAGLRALSATIAGEACTLEPAFQPANVNYTIILNDVPASILINAQANNSGATITGAGQKTLSAAVNTFNITVTAQDGVTQNKYVVTVICNQPSNSNCRVSFDSQGGTVIPCVSATVGGHITKPADPARTGHVFIGWFRNATMNSTWDFASDTVSGDITLFAKWSIGTYDVIFNSQGGSTVSSARQNYNSLVPTPDTPIYVGYTFGGWYLESACSTPWDFTVNTVTGNMTLYAKWIVNSYTIFFDSQYGSYVSSVTKKYGSKIGKPSDPILDGYNFGGWYKEPACINIWNFNLDTVQCNATLYAKWTAKSYLVTLDAQGGSVSPQTKTVVFAESYGQLPVPQWGKKVFVGWYTNLNGSGDHITSTSIVDISAPHTLCAKWEGIGHIVSFNSMGGSNVPSVAVKENGHIIAPTTPTRTGYSFIGWYKDEACTSEWVFATDKIPANDITLYAKWTINTYTVTFNSLGGSTVTSRTADYDAKITPPTAPTRSGYTFGGWYKEAACTNAWKFSTDIVKSDVTLYSKWIKITLTIPTSVVAFSTSYNSAKVSWNTVANASGYEVWRATSSSGTYTKIGTTASISFANSSLTTGTTYYYKVRGYLPSGSSTIYSGYSSVVSAKPVPATPASIKATPATYNSIKVTWAAVPGITKYELYRSTSSTGTSTLLTTTTSTSYTNTSVNTGTTYYYKVRAYRLVGTTKVYGAYSTTSLARTVLVAPGSVKAIPASYNSIKVTWGAVAGVSKYELYRATSSTGSYSLVASLSSLRYTNTSVTTGTTYYYKVRSYRSVAGKKVYSPFSVVVSAKTTLSIPTSLNAVRASSSSIKVSWKAVTGATRYEVWKSPSSNGTYTLLAITGSAKYTNTGLTKGTYYYYKVRAYRLIGSTKVYSGFSAVVYAKP